MAEQNMSPIAGIARKLCMVRDVQALPTGHIRIETDFLYPDGSFVDVFVVFDAANTLFPPSRISDLGQTMGFLLDHEVRPWSTKKRKAQLEAAISLYHVALDGGALVKDLTDCSPATLGAGVSLLAQACVRMADLIYTKRLQLQSAFPEEVEEFLADSSLPYETNTILSSVFGEVQVDFLVRGKSLSSAVLTLYSRMTSAAHTQSNEVLRKFYDLQRSDRSEERVTILDDSIDVSSIYRSEDIARLGTLSTVLPFSERDRVREVLSA